MWQQKSSIFAINIILALFSIIVLDNYPIITIILNILIMANSLVGVMAEYNERR